MSDQPKTSINYNWFGVKRPYPHYHYYVTFIDENTWVVEDNEPYHEGELRICYTSLKEGKFIDLLTIYEGGIPDEVIESVMRYIEKTHFQDWMSFEIMLDVD